MMIDDTEIVTLLDCSQNALLQLHALENYLRNPDNLLGDVWDKIADKCSFPGGGEMYDDEVNLTTMHSYRMRVIFNVLRELGKEYAGAEEPELTEEEQFNKRCTEILYRYCRIGIEIYDPWNEISQLQTIVQAVITRTGRTFQLFSNINMTQAMREFVQEYGTPEYMRDDEDVYDTPERADESTAVYDVFGMLENHLTDLRWFPEEGKYKFKKL